MGRQRQTSYRNIGSKKRSKKQEPASPCRANERELESLDLGIDVPKLENDGSVLQFVSLCNEDLYTCIIKLMKLRYWLDLGEKDAYHVSWNDGKNHKGVAFTWFKCMKLITQKRKRFLPSQCIIRFAKL